MEKSESDPYLTQGIIAYIGNKRRLLNLIGDAVRMAAGSSPEGLNFADLFSGSGIVSRFARRQGMNVISNDWEPYARILARAWLEPVPEDLPGLFGSENGLNDRVAEMNALPPAARDDRYLSLFYAPSSDKQEEADYRTERLFYTRANALKLDAARSWLERRYPAEGRFERGGSPENSAFTSEPRTGRENLARCMLLAPIIYAAATQVNTSGVFKACHKGFGGHGGDALSRITSPVRFQAPLIVKSPPGKVFSADAAELASSGELDATDVVYLDPPYNQHQYGSNYHLLNSLVLWDRIPEPLNLGPDGRLLRKAGIRKDWVDTRSPYCSRTSAEAAFSNLLDSLKAPLVLLSYSTDGIIPFERLRALCESYGKVSLQANPYVTYRGGRQSASRRDRNLEFVLIVEKGGTTRKRDRQKLDEVLMRRRLQLALGDLYRPALLRSSGKVEGSLWFPKLPEGKISIRTRHFTRIEEMPPEHELSAENTGALVRILDAARCRSRDEELEVIEAIWEENPGNCRDLLKDVPRILRKMAHRKYRDRFDERVASLRRIGRKYPEDFARISGSIESIEELARVRFAG